MLVDYDHEYRIHERFIGIFLAVARMVWAYIVVAVDPTLVVWCMAEMAAGVGEGWKRAMVMGKEGEYGGGKEGGMRGY